MAFEKILAIDVGNTRTKMGCFVEGELVATEHFLTDRSDTHLYLEELEHFSDISAILVSSVVPELTLTLESVFNAAGFLDRTVWINREWILQHPSNVNFSHYQDPLGSDRIANAIAGHERLLNKNKVICGFGTAATFDMVDEQGLYMGGAIAPGLKAFTESLHLAVPSLPPVMEMTQPGETPGFSTEACLQNGFYYGYKGLILEVLGNLLQSAGWPLSQVGFIFTGGDAEIAQTMVAFEIPNIQLEPTLALWGLYQAWLHNIIVGEGLKPSPTKA